jgi:8-oxo-dGTP pyrophosphatase MutT (NUDIX family)
MQSPRLFDHTSILDEAGFRAAAVRALHPTPVETVFDPRTGRSWGPSDFDLNPELAAELIGHERARAAAVLVPVVARPQLTMLLTLRTAHLPSHAGQIAFPGGKVDPTDADPVATALREAEEEIGLDRRFVEPLGFLDTYRTGTGFGIVPLVALIAPGFALELNTSEVADAFEVPLAFLLDAANHQRHARLWQGRERHFYAMPYEERYIWGATAGMIRNLHERLTGR